LRRANVVDAPRVAALLQRIREELSHLRRLGARDDGELFADPDAMAAAKYRLIVVIEAATDTADHVIAAEGLRPSTSFADSFRSLQEGGWLDAELADQLTDAARLRNVLVHQYADVDDRRVLEIIRTRLGDLDAFVSHMSRRLGDPQDTEEVPK
jgi:uncharacterized protein YutE (UPF0331/DUF86 family)